MAKVFLPYGRQIIDEDDIAAVVEALRSDWLTTGPAVERFEADVCAFTGAVYGVAVCNGTAALHATMFALGIGPGDEVIVPPMTFASTANCVLYQGGIFFHKCISYIINNSTKKVNLFLLSRKSMFTLGTVVAHLVICSSFS